MASGLNEFLLRLKNLFGKRRADIDMAAELEFHQTLLREKLLREGVPQGEVDAATRRAFGNASRWHEGLRELWQFRILENFLRDLGFAARMLSKSPGFTCIALLTLTLGVGANTAVFTLINGLLLRSLPVPHAEQLAVLRYNEGPEPQYDFPTPYFRALESRHDVFSSVYAYNVDVLQVKAAQGNENVPGVLVSGQYFQALETAPLLGRYLTPEDDRKGGSPEGLAVVISEHFWQSWFGRAPDIIGRKLVIANVPFIVVGVMPKRFIGADPTQRPEIYAPLSADPIIDAPRDHIDDGFNAWWLTVAARMKSGVTLEQANAQLLAVSNPILHEVSTSGSMTADEESHHFHFDAEPGSRGFTYARELFSKPLTVMFSMCGGILVLACLNLTSLLMARGAARQQELATRLAMGATRGRLVQQLLVESLLIAIVGTALGLGASPLVSHSLGVMLAGSNVRPSVVLDTSMDIQVFFFAALTAMIVALLIGLVPALRATGGELNAQIKDGQHSTQVQERRRIFPRVLMAFQVALALVLVTGAGLLATSLVRLYASGAGFDPHGLVSIANSMDKQQLDGQPLMQMYQQMVEGVKHLPGVKSASLQFIVPLSHRGWNGTFSTPAGGAHQLMLNGVAPDYFSTMKIPIYAGREFTWGDTTASGLKIVLNQTGAKLLFPNQNAVGQQLLWPRDKMSYEVVAVVGDAKYRDMRTSVPPQGYIPILQMTEKKPNLHTIVRTDGELAPLASAVKTLTSQLSPGIPAPEFMTMDDLMNNSLGTERMMAVLALFFAICALLVTAIGLYGTLAYATARRTSEIGIRMALGAARAQVVAMVFGENAVVAALGCSAGLAVAAFASKALASLLYGTSARDPWVLIGSVATLAVIASAASLLPALRASRINPMTAIRSE